MSEPEDQSGAEPVDPEADAVVEPDLRDVSDPSALEETWDDQVAAPAVEQDPEQQEPVTEDDSTEVDGTEVDGREIDGREIDGTEVDGTEDEPEEPALPALVETGHPGVDSALTTLEGLERRSVHEHVGVFEEAHTALRRALDETDQQA